MVELKSLELWSHDNLEALTRSYCETNKIKTSDMIHGLRAATTGKTVGIGVFDGMAILGKEPCLIRMNLAIDYAEWPE
jgi:glutamyl-tRNA synthetase